MIKPIINLFKHYNYENLKTYNNVGTVAVSHTDDGTETYRMG